MVWYSFSVTLSCSFICFVLSFPPPFCGLPGWSHILCSNPFQCFGAASVCTIVYGWKKEGGERRNPGPLCGKDSAGRWFCDYFSLPAEQAHTDPHAHHCPVCESQPQLELHAVSAYVGACVCVSVCVRLSVCGSAPTGQQRRRRASPSDDESRRQTGPWILMWRIVCFIEEQEEARWLPFRIC